MKSIYIFPFLILISCQLLSQTRNQNYIQNKVYTTADGTQYLENIKYFDDLGRPVQTVQKNITPSQKDLVTLQEYDDFGQESHIWLPAAIASNNGAFVAPATVKTNAAGTNGGDQIPYSQTIYEASPIKRPQKQFRPGVDWFNNDKAVKTEYIANSASGELSCMRFSINEYGVNTNLVKDNYFQAAQLYVTKVTDEDNNITYEFKNKQNQIILNRQKNGNELLDTYFVYDDFGNLCYVLPPIASESIITSGVNSSVIDMWGYIYKYDGRNRCIYKKIPGCEPVYYVYDKADQLIFTQDGEQRIKNEWTFSIADALGRIVLTGICKNSLNYAATDPLGSTSVVKATYNTGRTNPANSYTVTGITLSAPTILSVNFYDGYEFLGITGVPNTADTQYTTEAGYGVCYGDHQAANKYKNKGLLTGTLTAQMNADGTTGTTYLYSVMYYDNRARLIQTKSNNHLAGGLEKEYIAYNFTGQPTQRKHVHQATGKTTQTEVYAYTCDHTGRLLKTTHQLTDGTTVKDQVTLAENDYDELGRLKSNKKGGRAELNTTYTYNVRSWTTKILSPLFTQNLSYNTLIPGVTANAQWNGNISSMSWTVQGDTERKYGFVYDNLSRLKDANYVGAGSYTTNYTYDKHGNIKTLQQYGKREAGNAVTSYGLVDNLTMDHNGNQLTWTGDAGVNVSIAESADFKDKPTTRGTIEYTYNRNGALYSDLNKGITEIQYNSLNLPKQMVINSSSVKAKNYYTYSASGVKLRTEQRYDPTLSVAPVSTTTPANDGLSNYYTNKDYVGNIIYETEKKDAAITNKTRILVDGGYIENGTYYFYLTDHLGNNRVVANASGTVIQKNHYYPFGTAFAEGTAAEQGKQPYKYNGKELDQMHGLNLYDYSARYYESAIGRFTTVDPLAEMYYSWSPYAYCGNNPVNRIDPTGMYFDEVNNKKALKIENNLDKQISKLEKQVAKLERQGKDVGDRNDRISELRSSKSDISDMRNNENTEFRYAKVSDKNNPAGQGNPVTSATGTNGAGDGVVTMYTEGNMGNQIHESKHGGQIARGEYSFDQRGNPTAGYGIGSEVSAYRAQYSYDGKLNYIDASSALNQQLGSTGITPPISTLTGIQLITPDFVRTRIGEVRSAVIRGNRVYGLAPIYGRLP